MTLALRSPSAVFTSRVSVEASFTVVWPFSAIAAPAAALADTGEYDVAAMMRSCSMAADGRGGRQEPSPSSTPRKRELG